MQVTLADSNSSKRVGVEEHLIKFRSSPNFKNMKKFIMLRSETTSLETAIVAALGAPDPPPPPNIRRTEMVNPEVQPPLPLDPPPPDNLILNLQVKEEIEDIEYQNNIHLSPELENPEIDGNSEQTNDLSGEICRDFIRGTCKRQGSCKYAHKHDLSQLEGVYTFCRKYQNSVCTFTNCKYVHATVFEEQHFYRTGILPQHALAHHKVSVMQPPPPPPPPEEPPIVSFNIDFSNPPPPLPNEIEKPMISCIPASSMEARGYMDTMHNPMPTRTTSPLKREWSNMESFAVPPCDLDYNEQLTKKCKHCDIMEFRLQYNKDKVEKMLQSKEDLSKKMGQLDKKSEKLMTVLLALLKPTMTTKAQTHTNGLNGDKDKTLLDQLNSILSVNSRLSTLGEEK